MKAWSRGCLPRTASREARTAWTNNFMIPLEKMNRTEAMSATTVPMDVTEQKLGAPNPASDRTISSFECSNFLGQDRYRNVDRLLPEGRGDLQRLHDLFHGRTQGQALCMPESRSA